MNETSVAAAGRANPAKARPKVYLETSFFGALFGPENDRWRVARDIMDDAREGRIEVVISALTLVECEFPADIESVELLNSYFESDWLVRCNVDPFVANTARDLRGQLESVTPLASNLWLHVATAMWEGCGYLMTHDRRLQKLQGQRGLELVHVMAPARPWDAGQMSLIDLEGVMSTEPSRRSVVI